MGKSVVRRLWFIVFLSLALFADGAVRADTFQLTTGEELSGELLPSSANDQSVQVKVGEGTYKRVPWTSFSQEDLKKFKQNPKLEPLVEPYVEVTQEERIKKTEVTIKEPTRLPEPAKQSLFAALFSSGLGLFILLLLYAAGIYAGYEVALFKAQSVPLVAGLSAIPFLGWVVPIIFLCIPMKIQAAPETWDTQPAQGVPQTAATTEAFNPMQGEAQQPGGLSLHHEAPAATAAAPGEAGAPAQPSLPQTQTFSRGQFTFNRRFIETKFPGFFGMTRRDADKDMVLVVKASRGEYIAHRISRIAANDFHLEVHARHTTQEIMIPFQEIKEIQLKHKDAP